MAQGRWVVLATVLGTGMAMLDMTAVNVALPAIGRQFGASLSGLQWIVSGYTLALAALILLGGSLGDRLGRRRVFVTGVLWFALASALCGLAPTTGVLIAARVLQGIGGALLVPGSLAIIQASFARPDRPRAIGAWSGLSGVASAVGPLLGGWLVVTAGWRWVFLINLPVAAVVTIVALRRVPESGAGRAARQFDVAGAGLAAFALAAISYALISGPAGAAIPVVATVAAAGGGAGIAFIALERRRARQPGGPAPMLPMDIFASRQFSLINVITFCVYGAFSGELFLLVLDLQAGAGFSALAAGAALLPVTCLMLVLSPRTAALAQRAGPRRPLAAGTVICAAGLLLMLRIGVHAAYLTDVLPAVVVFGLGLTLVVSPLTVTVLASADVRHAGLASGVNNAVARTASLIAVAGLPAVAGLSAAGYRSPAQLTSGFHLAMIVCAGFLVASSLLTITMIDDRVLRDDAGPRPAASGRGRRSGSRIVPRPGPGRHEQLPDAERAGPVSRPGQE